MGNLLSAPASKAPAAPQSAVIVPLYQYPLTSTSWERLHKAITKHSHLTFIIIINPNSGPGVSPDGWLPDKRYIKEIPRLTVHQNVTAIGYVRLDYCRRPYKEVEEDVMKYANWSGSPTTKGDNSSNSIGRRNLGMQGIFFDETPNLYSTEVAAYLDTIGQLVKSSTGVLGSRLIIHNPGTVPDTDYTIHWAQSRSVRLPPMPPTAHFTQAATSERNSSFIEDTITGNGAPDISVVFEASHSLWLEAAVQTRLAALLRYDRHKCCYMVHSVRPRMAKDLTMELRRRGGYVFITTLSERYYESFGTGWEEFIEAMIALD